ncbi:hypothetical protein WJR50_14690 [Catalinimonas sp. 4WD22]|uniref:hypothetical protein n=1 Tax=Catalinimonas locisalis TaxID=3133978 RepID=UPI003101A193
MKYLSILILCVFTSCQPDTEPQYFSHLQDEEKVMLAMSNYGLEEVPPQIRELKNVKDLTISQTEPGGWVFYPPLNRLVIKDFDPPYRELPEEILSLSQLRHLSLSGMDLHCLPKDLHKLEQLETLNLAFNKLNISAELPKLKALPNLRELNVLVNNFDSLALKQWMQERPGLKIIY